MSTVAINIDSRSTLQAFGDSFTTGYGLTPSTLRYSTLFAADESLTETNNAVSARGVWNQAAAAQSVNPTKSTALYTWMVGLNDIRRATDQAKTRKKIEAATRALILSALADTRVAAGDAATVKTGTTSAFNTTGVGGTYSGGRYINGTSGSIAWTFTGTACGVQLIANSGDVETYGTCNILIDDVVVESVDLDTWYDNVSDGAYDNRRGPIGFTFHGLTDASHTIKVVATNSGFVPIDFFCTCHADAADAAAVMLCEIPYLSTAGYAISPANGSTSVSDSASTVLRDLAVEYQALGYDVGYADINDSIDLTTDVQGDDIHYDTSGHEGLRDALVLAVSAASVSLTSPVSTDRRIVGLAEAITWVSANTATVDIEISTDGGTSWSTLAAGETSDGTYDWTPTVSQMGDSVQIRVATPDDAAVATSASFRVATTSAANPQITLLQASAIQG